MNWYGWLAAVAVDDMSESVKNGNNIRSTDQPQNHIMCHLFAARYDDDHAPTVGGPVLYLPLAFACICSCEAR